MARFHLHLIGPRGAYPDEEGGEFESAEHAYLEVFKSAQEIWHELLLKLEDPRSFVFHITDAAGTSIVTVPFTEVLDACRGSPHGGRRRR